MKQFLFLIPLLLIHFEVKSQNQFKLENGLQGSYSVRYSSSPVSQIVDINLKNTNEYPIYYRGVYYIIYNTTAKIEKKINCLINPGETKDLGHAFYFNYTDFSLNTVDCSTISVNKFDIEKFQNTAEGKGYYFLELNKSPINLTHDVIEKVEIYNDQMKPVFIVKNNNFSGKINVVVKFNVLYLDGSEKSGITYDKSIKFGKEKKMFSNSTYSDLKGLDALYIKPTSIEIDGKSYDILLDKK